MVRWTLHCNVADVLSLGPRTAGRLMQVGVRTVADLLAAKPQAIARRVNDEPFNAKKVEDWQREAQLVIAAQQLPTRATRILAAAGYHSPERIARSTPTELFAAIEQEGRIGWLEKSSRPGVSELADWICCAQQCLSDHAA